MTGDRITVVRLRFTNDFSRFVAIETNASGAVVARYAGTQSVDEPLAEVRSGTTSYYEADGLGSITSLSNAAGSLVQTYTLDPFGNETASSGSLTNPFGFTGREFDSETNLYFYRARYYDPTIGRFTKEDPIRFGGGDPNFYSYVSQSPINFADASGKTRFWGNWCGPIWTGRMGEPFNPKHFKDYKKPIDPEDEACMHHDICYFDCRSQHPCSPDGRSKCFRSCDKLFINELPLEILGVPDLVGGVYLWYPLALHFHPDPESNGSCGCYKVTWIK
jgi:RHS repeat-associated protein